MAAAHGVTDIATVLISHGASVDTRTHVGQTPLHVTVNNGHVDMAELLLSHGADIEARDKDAMTPLLLATKSGIISFIDAALLCSKCLLNS